MNARSIVNGEKPLVRKADLNVHVVWLSLSVSSLAISRLSVHPSPNFLVAGNTLAYERYPLRTEIRVSQGKPVILVFKRE